MLFTTGRGTPLGFPVPTIKISTNTEIFQNKPNWIDFNAGQIAYGEETFEQAENRLWNYLLDVASGLKKTNNEKTDIVKLPSGKKASPCNRSKT